MRSPEGIAGATILRAERVHEEGQAQARRASPNTTIDAGYRRRFVGTRIAVRARLSPGVSGIRQGTAVLRQLNTAGRVGTLVRCACGNGTVAPSQARTLHLSASGAGGLLESRPELHTDLVMSTRGCSWKPLATGRLSQGGGVRTERSDRSTTHLVTVVYRNFPAAVYSLMHNSRSDCRRGERTTSAVSGRTAVCASDMTEATATRLVDYMTAGHQASSLSDKRRKTAAPPREPASAGPVRLGEPCPPA